VIGRISFAKKRKVWRGRRGGGTPAAIRGLAGIYWGGSFTRGRDIRNRPGQGVNCGEITFRLSAKKGSGGGLVLQPGRRKMKRWHPARGGGVETAKSSRTIQTPFGRDSNVSSKGVTSLSTRASPGNCALLGKTGARRDEGSEKTSHTSEVPLIRGSSWGKKHCKRLGPKKASIKGRTTSSPEGGGSSTLCLTVRSNGMTSEKRGRRVGERKKEDREDQIEGFGGGGGFASFLRRNTAEGEASHEEARFSRREISTRRIKGEHPREFFGPYRNASSRAFGEANAGKNTEGACSKGNSRRRSEGKGSEHRRKEPSAA